ncbi:WecB/TagA/CpsF family glycosyltransferase [Candidatus Daviesbacteria bacterium]|nr:WecB/TagA/CpsF family glycosyltransferase [Candidatus Daviesbacteria bacterium]
MEGFTVGLLGGRNGVASQTAKRLQKLYPKLKITIAEDGPELTGINSSESLSARGPAAPVSQVRPRGLTSHAAVDSRDLSSASPLGISIPPTDILFVAFGQVKQEKWITENLSEIPVKVAMGVGGAFDYISGRVPRAPIWMRRLGLEWLFRLITQPWRIRRQMVLLKFAWLTFTKKA